MPFTGRISGGQIPLMEITVADDTGVVNNFSTIGLKIQKKVKDITKPEHRKAILEMIAQNLCGTWIKYQFMFGGGILSGRWVDRSEGSRGTHPLLIYTSKLFDHVTDYKASVGIRVKGRYGVGWTDDSLTLGLKDVGYGRWHQTGTKKMPARPIVQYIPHKVLMSWKTMIINFLDKIK